jgi:hypothetical protein
VPAVRPLVKVEEPAGKFAILNPPSKGGRGVSGAGKLQVKRLMWQKQILGNEMEDTKTINSKCLSDGCEDDTSVRTRMN